MAKKIKRNLSVQAPLESAAPVTYSRPAASAAAPRPSSYTPEFKPDYSLVLSDLKRIASLAGVFTVALVVLSFFLR